MSIYANKLYVSLAFVKMFSLPKNLILNLKENTLFDRDDNQKIRGKKVNINYP